MSEQYPPDSDLNALDATTDAVTGLPYLTIAESPFYTHRFKLFNWLARVLAFTANALRVYKDGDLTFGVRAGRYHNGDTAVNYAGAAAQALTNNQTNYIYLTASGTLTVNTTGFLTPSATPNIPLATILTAAGEYACDDITDYRSRALFAVLSGITAANTNTLSDGSNADALHLHDPLANAVADPGDAGAIAVTESGSCPLVTAGAETRTLAIPTQVGRMLSLAFKTDGGDCVITVASGVNQTGNNTLTFADAGDHILLQAIDAGTALAWRIVCNDGVALSTV